jgi:hypothetical protein
LGCYKAAANAFCVLLRHSGQPLSFGHLLV